MAHLTLDEKIVAEAACWLAERDLAMRQVLERYGPPPLWARQPGFATLAHIILEQQVSLASANATFARLELLLGEIAPDKFLELDDQTLRNIGYSRQKIAYTRNLAEQVAGGRLDLLALARADDAEVRAQLTRLKGIGAWTSDIYLSECLLRPDILPQGDIAMQEAFRTLKGLDKRPTHSEFEAGTFHWRPWRSVGTRMLWHFYLSEKKAKV